MKLLRPAVGRFPAVFYRVALGTGWAMWHTRPEVRRNLVRNLLPLCDGDVDRARREGIRVCQYVSQYYVDLVSLPRRDLARFEREKLEFVNPQHIARLADPGPIVAVSAHTGNAELAVQAFLTHGRSFVAIVEAQQPPDWSRYLIRLRSARGGRFYESDFSGVRASLEALRAGDVLGVMGDRDIQGTGICVDLCGRQVKLPRGPWELARRTNALVMPVFASRKKTDHFRVDLAEPFHVNVSDDAEADIREAALRFACILETHLRRDPGQWTVLEDFWNVHACHEAAL